MKPQSQIAIAVAPAAFKGTLGAFEAARRITRGLRKALPTAHVYEIPMADGGDDTLRVVIRAIGGSELMRRVCDPLGRPISAPFGLAADGATAVVESAKASGLVLLEPDERNPMLASTFGTGELIRHALDAGARKIVVGIGGSAANDGGTGMAAALGVRFRDTSGRKVAPNGAALLRIAQIDVSGLDPRIARTAISVACDVANPLLGPRGAARVYAPQKGATPAMVLDLERGLRNVARLIKRDLGVSVERAAGAGAAGGLGAGLAAFLAASLRPGAELIAEIIGLEQRFRDCDLVITGEGRLDRQSAFGKAPVTVARIARRLGLPVIAICGSIGPGVSSLRRVGLDTWFAASQHDAELPLSHGLASRYLEECAEQVGRLIATAARLMAQRRSGSQETASWPASRN